MNTIYLTGFMGSGKSTVGKKLADKLEIPGYDLDALIEKRIGMAISDAFASRGEEFFRKAETEVLKELPVSGAIVMTGGGVVLKEENRQWMKENGVVIYLSCDVEEIKKRLEGDTSRPLIQGERLKEIERLFLGRQALYEEADIIVETTGKTPENIVREIKGQLSYG
ncbi:MAG: shikimate kinase [Bacillus sp. (in: firmicutes)]